MVKSKFSHIIKQFPITISIDLNCKTNLNDIINNVTLKRLNSKLINFHDNMLYSNNVFKPNLNIIDVITQVKNY